MKPLLAAVTLFLAAGAANASPCVSGSLADYIALGSGGCSIGDKTLSDFSAASFLTGAAAIDAANVNVAAVGGAFNFGLDFSLTPNAPSLAGPTQLLDILLGYHVTGSSLIGASLGLGNSAATGDGAVTVVTNVCANGLFSPNLLCNGPSNAGLLAVTTESLSFPFDSAPLTISSFFDVFTELTLDGGFAGSASLNGVVSNRFSIPAPDTLALLSVAMFGLIAVMRRRKQPPSLN